jgi:hypothetical protein
MGTEQQKENSVLMKNVVQKLEKQEASSNEDQHVQFSIPRHYDHNIL